MQSCHTREDRHFVSINLGPSPQYDKSVHLLPNMQSRMVTPQFHVTFDISFDMTQSQSHVWLPICYLVWQKKSLLVKQEDTPLVHDFSRKEVERYAAKRFGQSPHRTRRHPQTYLLRQPSTAQWLCCQWLRTRYRRYRGQLKLLS